jgi:4'-phosphopantetheinyl transferase
MTAVENRWSPPVDNISLSNSDVHIWRASLNLPGPRVDELARVLSADEQERAGRFHFERDRRRFIVARAALRTILGQYELLEPGRLRFRYGPQGKPFLVDQSERNGLKFNIAHSHELALLGFTRGRELGVDLEYIRPLKDLDQIAARFFSARENAVLKKLPSSQRQVAFYTCWTRKEAYIKAIGEGLSMPLDAFDVSLGPDAPAALISVRDDPDEALRWSMQALRPAPNYIAAFIVAGRTWHLARWQWTG